MRVAVVGAGLAGSILASRLAENHTVVVYDRALTPHEASAYVQDRARPHGAEQLLGFGPGGTTRFWHNGLIRPEPEVAATLGAVGVDLDPYWDAAFSELSDVNAETYDHWSQCTRVMFAKLGHAHVELGNPLYYPRRRRNIFQRHGQLLAPRLRAEWVERLEERRGGKVCVISRSPTGGSVTEEYDVCVCAAGGLFTPLLLQRSMGSIDATGERLIGRNYEDHPMFFLGVGRARIDLSRAWNIRVSKGGTLRAPIKFRHSGGIGALYLRPSWHQLANSRRARLKSNLSNLRNRPGDLDLYLALIRNPDDLFEVLAMKMGWSPRSDWYSVLVVAEEPPQGAISQALAAEGGDFAQREWALPDSGLAQIAEAAEVATRRSELFSEFQTLDFDQIEVRSAAHHSGTCRIARGPASGVADGDGRVFGCRNIFVCDGSALPRSGFANTGLMIAALALRTAEFLDREF